MLDEERKLTFFRFSAIPAKPSSSAGLAKYFLNRFRTEVRTLSAHMTKKRRLHPCPNPSAPGGQNNRDSKPSRECQHEFCSHFFLLP